jgi:hypothetical protein
MIQFNGEFHGISSQEHLKKVSSVFNSHIPYYATESYSVEKGVTEDGKKYVLFGYPSVKEDSHWGSKSSSIKNIMGAFNDSSGVTRFIVNNRTLYVTKGLVIDKDGNILLMLAVKKEAYFSGRSLREYGESFSYDDYTLFYARELHTDPSWSLLNRRFQKDILPNCFTKGIEVLIMPLKRIKENTLSDGIKYQFESISEMQRYLESSVRNMLLTEEETVNNISDICKSDSTEVEPVEPQLISQSREPAIDYSLVNRIIYNVELIDDTEIELIDDTE